jgi:protein-L-isoaspartate(D-aspartate) O-methyltransferase
MRSIFSKHAEDLIADLKRYGIRDERVIAAMAATPREKFVEDGFEAQAFDDTALPIACGQTISQPYIVALMTELLEVRPDSCVLEVGTGSGYQAAVLSRLARMVYTVERHRPLADVARKRFEALGLTNIEVKHGDGYKGWEEKAPFERVLVTAAAPELPEGLAVQLKPGGILVTPLGYETISQRLWKIIRTADGLKSEAHLPAVFVPMIPGLPPEERGTDDDTGKAS